MTLGKAEKLAVVILAKKPLPPDWAEQLDAISAQLKPMDQEIFAQYYEAGYLASDGV